MRVIVLAAAAMLLAGCTTAEMQATNAGGGQEMYQREAPIPPALRTPRQKSAVGLARSRLSPVEVTRALVSLLSEMRKRVCRRTTRLAATPRQALAGL